MGEECKVRDLVEAFLQKTEISAVSLLSYRRDLEKLMSHFSDHPETAKQQDLIAYFSDCGKILSSSSLSRQVSVVRSFYAFLKEAGIRSENPMDGIRASCFIKKQGETLDREEFARLISCPIPGFRGIRDRAMLILLCETGLRVTELVNLDCEDLREKVLFCGHGRRRRSLPLSASAFDALSKYLAVRSLYEVHESEPLFLTVRGMRMTRQGFWKNLKDRAIYSGIDKPISPHTLRRSLALHWMEEGRAREEISGLLGNADPASLRSYKSGKTGV